MTMSPDPGGVFATLRGLTRRGLGGQIGDGRQFMTWIHEEDNIRAVRWLIARADLAGPVNLAAPHPLPNAAFLRALREAAGIPFGLPAPEWVLKSRRVVPTRLLDSGFTFHFPTWPEAARDLCGRWLSRQTR